MYRFFHRWIRSELFSSPLHSAFTTFTITAVANRVAEEEEERGEIEKKANEHTVTDFDM